MPVYKIYRRRHYTVLLAVYVVSSVLFGALFCGIGVTTIPERPAEGIFLALFPFYMLFLIWQHFLAEVHVITIHQSGRIEFRRLWPGMTQRIHAKDISVVYRPTGLKRLRIPVQHRGIASAIVMLHTDGIIELPMNASFEHFDDFLATLKTLNPGITFDGVDIPAQRTH